jgi:hypothetical protein
VKNRVAEWWRCGGRQGENKLRESSWTRESQPRPRDSSRIRGLSEREKVKSVQRRCDGCWRSRGAENCENLCSRERPQGRDRRGLP